MSKKIEILLGLTPLHDGKPNPGHPTHVLHYSFFVNSLPFDVNTMYVSPHEGNIFVGRNEFGRRISKMAEYACCSEVVIINGVARGEFKDKKYKINVVEKIDHACLVEFIKKFLPDLSIEFVDEGVS